MEVANDDNDVDKADDEEEEDDDDDDISGVEREELIVGLVVGENWSVRREKRRK